MPQQYTDDGLRTCAQCSKQYAFDEFKMVGFIDKSLMPTLSTPSWYQQLLHGLLRPFTGSDNNEREVQAHLSGLPHLR